MWAAIVPGVKAAESLGWLQEEIVLERREHPQSGPGPDRQWWFAAKLVAALVVTMVAAYVTAMLL